MLDLQRVAQSTIIQRLFDFHFISFLAQTIADSFTDKTITLSTVKNRHGSSILMTPS